MKHFCKSCGRPTIYSLTLPKFCSNCGTSFANTINITPSESFNLTSTQKPSTLTAQPHIETKAKISPKFHANISFEEKPTKSELLNDNIDDIDSENFDTSKFKNIVPKFKVEAMQSNRVSFENLVTNGYMSNSRPMIIENEQIDGQRNNQSILDEFRKEAGETRSASE